MDVILSSSGEHPIYEQIASQIKRQILSGKLQTGELLPSMRALAKELRISVITTKRAYEELEADGLINTVTGRGSFVAGADPQAVLEQHRVEIERALCGAIEAARRAGIPLAELHETLDTLYTGEM